MGIWSRLKGLDEIGTLNKYLFLDVPKIQCSLLVVNSKEGYSGATKSVATCNKNYIYDVLCISSYNNILL